MSKFRLPRKEKKRFKKAYYRAFLAAWFKGYFDQYNYTHWKQFNQVLPF